MTPPTAGSIRAGPKSGSSSPASIRACSPLHSAAPVERGAAHRRRVDEHRKAERAPSRSPSASAACRARSMSDWAQRNERHDVGDADPRVRALVIPRVDPLARDRGRRPQARPRAPRRAASVKTER